MLLSLKRMKVVPGTLFRFCAPIVTAVTRVTPSDIKTTDDTLLEKVNDIMGLVKKNTWVVSSDQIKNNLQAMEALTTEKGGHWAMPIRKVAALDYPYEQIHGRCAALAERCAQLFYDSCQQRC